MAFRDRSRAEGQVPDDVAKASVVFVRRCMGTWTSRDQAKLQRRLARDSRFAAAMESVERAWKRVGVYAAAPVLIAFQDQAAESLALQVGASSTSGGGVHDIGAEKTIARS